MKNVSSKDRGRPKTTGKYDTTEELVSNVWFFFKSQNQAQVARTCQVSETTVANILKQKKPKE